jgi:hypothetical protein
MIELPYRFDTRRVWRGILWGAFGLNALLALGTVVTLVVRDEWRTALGLGLVELMVLNLTRRSINAQEGSAGTLWSDRVVVEPNVLFGIALPGPSGVYPRDRFAGVRVEYRSGSAQVDVQDSGPHHVVWLVGKPGTPDVLLARCPYRARLTAGREFGILLSLPVEETGTSRQIRL